MSELRNVVLGARDDYLTKYFDGRNELKVDSTNQGESSADEATAVPVIEAPEESAINVTAENASILTEETETKSEVTWGPWVKTYKLFQSHGRVGYNRARNFEISEEATEADILKKVINLRASSNLNGLKGMILQAICKHYNIKMPEEEIEVTEACGDGLPIYSHNVKIIPTFNDYLSEVQAKYVEIKPDESAQAAAA